MTVRLSTTVRNIEKTISNPYNVEIILRFFEFMKQIGTSERYQNNNLKAIIAYTKFLEPSTTFDQVKSRSQNLKRLVCQIPLEQRRRMTKSEAYPSGMVRLNSVLENTVGYYIQRQEKAKY